MLADETLEGHHTAWTYAGDGVLVTNLARANVQPEIPNNIVVNDGAGLLSSIAVVDPARGGLGTNVVPANGYIPIGNGTTYTPALLSSDGTIIITPGPGTLHLSALGGGGGGGGGSSPKIVISEQRWLVSSSNEIEVAVMPWRAASWVGLVIRTVYFWHEPTRGFVLRCRNHLGIVLGSVTVAFGAAAGLASMILSAQLTDSVLSFTIQGDGNNAHTSAVKGLYLDAF